jgi:hypothetical protein
VSSPEGDRDVRKGQRRSETRREEKRKGRKEKC